MPFEKNVFINCPFDDEYRPLLRALLFTISYLGFEPKISETVSSATIRAGQIQKLIKESKYSIHDLSRCKPLKKNELPRFNMPYELGLDIGCLTYGGNRMKQKKVLVLETEKHFYKKVLSDIAGQDIQDHHDEPKVLIQKTRDWFSVLDDTIILEGGNGIWIAFNQFSARLTEELKANHYTDEDISKMPASDYIKFCKDWIRKFQAIK